MTREIDASTGFVIELGPGTGAFTRALLARGVPEKNLTLVEVGSNFAAMLGLRFPKARILCADAADLTAVDYWRNGKVGAVVSGLPLLSMPTAKIIAIMAGAFSHLRDDGAFYQFTYGPRCPVPAAILDQLGLGATHVGRTLWNFPPAAVYRISRKSR
jgi:phosphatidylethanolamine/phosphatidyl-N-methylethanolamine N-methyltransferase